jgi:hypothetical protein
MIIRNFDLERVVIFPNKTDPILIVDPYRKLVIPITLHRFKTVARCCPQILQPRCRFEQLKFTKRRPSKRRRWIAAGCSRQPQLPRFRVAEAANHSAILTYTVHNGHRYELRQIWQCIGTFREFAQAFHYGRSREEFAEEIDFTAQFFVRNWF